MPDIAFAIEADLAPTRLDELRRELMRDLGRVGAPAQQLEIPAGPRERGAMASIGGFVIDTLLSTKTVTAVLDVLKAYIMRDRSLRISVTRPDGTKIEVDANNVGSAAIAEFLEAARAIT